MKRKISEDGKGSKKAKVAGAGILKKSLEEVEEDSDEDDDDDDDSKPVFIKIELIYIKIEKKGKQGGKRVSFSNKVVSVRDSQK